MASQSLSQRLVLEPENPQRLANLCGRLNEHLKQIEKRLLVKIQNRGNEFMVIGAPDAVKNSARIIHKLYDMTQDTQDLAPDTIHITIQEGINNAGQASIQKDVEKSMEESMEKNMNKPPAAEDHGAIEESEENNAFDAYQRLKI